MAKRPSFLFLAFLTSGLLTTAAWSQQPAFDPSRAAQSIRPDISGQPLLRSDAAQSPLGLTDENSFAPPTPGDSDIGQQLILKRQEHLEPFYASLDSSEFYTNNAADAHTGTKSDWFYVGGATVGWQPRITQRLYFDSFIAEHLFRYAELSALNYEQGEASVGLIMLIPELWNSAFHLHYYYERITQGLGDTPTYQAHTIRAGAQKTVLIDRLNSIDLSLLAQLAVSASPDNQKREEYSFYTAWNFKIRSDWFFTASYRLGYFDYLDFDDRSDWYNNFGVALSYRPRKWLEMALSWNYTLNRSSQDVFSYDAQLAGPSVSVKAKF